MSSEPLLSAPEPDLEGPAQPALGLPRTVAYCTSASLTALASRLPSNVGRSRQVHELVRALGLLDDGTGSTSGSPSRATVVAPKLVGKRELARFHGVDFCDFLLGANAATDTGRRPPSSPASSDSDASGASSPVNGRASKRRRTTAGAPRAKHARFGLVDDSPPFDGLADYCVQVAGASLAAAEEVREGRAQVGVSWDGGRHHAKRSSCSGFCYVNDAVLAILALSDKRVPDERRPAKMRKARVMYIDFDVHHGDGVAEAFLSTPPSKPSVLTFSIHHHAPFFFPSTRASERTPADTSSPHTLSLPLTEGTSAPSLVRAWACVQRVKDAWQPDFVVVCAGVDGLAGDGKGVWNLSSGEQPGELGWVVRRICDWGLGTVLLGGGGYNHPSVARTWAQFTSIALGQPPLDSSLPLPIDNLADEFVESYAPSYNLAVPAGNMSDRNTEDDLAETERVFAILADRVRVD